MPVLRIAILIVPVVAILTAKALVKTALLPFIALRQMHRNLAARV